LLFVGVAAAVVHIFPSQCGKATPTMDSAAVEQHQDQQPVLLLSHGAGPCFFLEGGSFIGLDRHSQATKDMTAIANALTIPPKAVLVISAHYETERSALSIVGDTDDVVPLLFDYYGFPNEAYSLTWPCRGSKWLASEVRKLMDGFALVGADQERGFDHGVFIPLKLVFPEAQIPTIQLSISASLDPQFHHDLGKRLTPLRKAGVLIVGSGSLTHGRGSGTNLANEKAFASLVDSKLLEAGALRDAHKVAPHFRDCHPRTEHWVPFIVGAAAAEGASKSKLLCSHWWHALGLISYLLE